MNRPWFLAFLLPLGAACSSSPPGHDPAVVAANTAAARAAIAAANLVLADASIRGDARSTSDLFTEDITAMGVDGIDQIGRPAWVDGMAKGYATRTFDLLESHIVTDTVEVHGDFAYEMGRDMSVSRPKGSPKAAPDTTRARYFTFWRRGSDGKWRASRDFTVTIPKPAK